MTVHCTRCRAAACALFAFTTFAALRTPRPGQDRRRQGAEARSRAAAQSHPGRRSQRSAVGHPHRQEGARATSTAYDLRGKVPGQTDLDRLKAGGVGAQFWSVYIPGEIAVRIRAHAAGADRHRATCHREISGQVCSLRHVRREIRAARREGRIASLLGMEGGHAIENSLGALRAYYDLGVRYMTLTHNVHTSTGPIRPRLPPEHGGLTPFGEQVVQRDESDRHAGRPVACLR